MLQDVGASIVSEREWRDAAAMLPFLADPKAPVTHAFVAQVTLMRFLVAATVFEAGVLCSVCAILAQGRVRVFTIGETGREITAYAPFGISTCKAPAGKRNL